MKKVLTINKEKLLPLLKQGLNEEAKQKKEETEEKKDILKETLMSCSENLNSPNKIKARFFFRTLAKIALSGDHYWITPEQLYEELIS